MGVIRGEISFLIPNLQFQSILSCTNKTLYGEEIVFYQMSLGEARNSKQLRYVAVSVFDPGPHSPLEGAR